MPILELGSGSPFTHVLVKCLRPKKSSLFQEAMARLGALGVSAQLIDSKGVAGLDHIRTAAILTAISFKNGKNLARSPATELLLYASARRQIKEAIKRLGVNSRTRSWVLVSISESIDALQKSSELFASYGQEDDTAMEITPANRKRLMILFDISPEELALAMELHGDSDTALKALVIERVALSELYR